MRKEYIPRVLPGEGAWTNTDSVSCVIGWVVTEEKKTAASACIFPALLGDLPKYVSSGAFAHNAVWFCWSWKDEKEKESAVQCK
jgi:hypothetical protein